MKVTQSYRTLRPHGLWPQSPLFMESSRQESWSGFPFPSPGDLPNPGIKPGSPALRADSLPPEPPGNPCNANATLNFGNKKGGRQASSRKSLPHVPKLINTPATLCNPIDWSPSGSSVHGILQARILEWVALSSSRRPSQLRGQIRVSCVS